MPAVRLLNDNSALPGWSRRRDEMIFGTVPVRVVLGSSRTVRGSRFRSAILADRAIRGSAISFATLARVALMRAASSRFLFLLSFFLVLLCRIELWWRRITSAAAPFRTLAKSLAGSDHHPKGYLRERFSKEYTMAAVLLKLFWPRMTSEGSK
jgi:hypothetical protein